MMILDIVAGCLEATWAGGALVVPPTRLMHQQTSSPASTGPKPFHIDAAMVLDHLEVAVLVADREGEILYRNLEAAELLAEGDNLQSVFKVVRFGAESHWRVNVSKVISSRCSMQWSGTFIAEPARQLHIRCAPLYVSGAAATVAVLYLECRSAGGAEEQYDITRRLTATLLEQPAACYKPMPLREALEEPEKRILEAALRANGWNRQLTAQQLVINRTTLYKKMKRYGLDGNSEPA